MEIKFQPTLRIRFAAKVALAAGYFIYGDIFRNNIDVSELRSLMNYHGEEFDEEFFKGLKLKGWFWPRLPDNKDLLTHAYYEKMAQHIGKSFVAIITRNNPDDILIVVAVLGNLSGIIRCKAVSSEFPVNHEYDLGHVVILDKHTLRRVSYRDLLMEISELDKAANAM